MVLRDEEEAPNSLTYGTLSVEFVDMDEREEIPVQVSQSNEMCIILRGQQNPPPSHVPPVCDREHTQNHFLRCLDVNTHIALKTQHEVGCEVQKLTEIESNKNSRSLGWRA